MTPQELDSQLEQLAEQGAPADVLVSLMASENVPADRATKIAVDWINYIRRKNKSVSVLSEFERMALIFLPRCKQVHDPSEIAVSPEQWAKNIARAAIELLREKDESTTMKIGMKVREIEVDDNMEPVLDANGQKKFVEGFYQEGKFFEALGKYGVILGNPATVDAELKPFDGFDHNLNDLRVKPSLTDGEIQSAEVENGPKPILGYAPVDDLYVNPASHEPTREFDRQYIEFLSELVCVQWFRADGTECEINWHPPISLEGLP
jgi:hypothetical protein